MRTFLPFFALMLVACEPTVDTGEPEKVDTAGEDSACTPEDEVCDGVDNDCDGLVDEEVAEPWFVDADGDGFGAGAEVLACEAPDGHVPVDGDCDDGDAGSFPGAPEDCDGVDDDCDGQVDDGVGEPWYLDGDSDGFGDPEVPATACAAPEGYVADATDCDDSEADTNPVALERCDGEDDDCDGQIDDDAVDAVRWYPDGDTDGHGDPETPVWACEAPDGHVADDTDCDDADAEVSPSATEWCNGKDDDCDGDTDEDAAADAAVWVEDLDHDGYGGVGTTVSCDAPAGYVDNADDCDDAVFETNPGAAEQCNDVDDDCDGTIDDGVTTSTWYADADGDTYGDATTTVDDCAVPTGYVGDDTDCDDVDAAVNPGAVEACNGIDDDCDGAVDEGEATGSASWYADADADGYGDAGSVSLACDAPAGSVADDTDCDDGDASVNPGATETCDGRDEDCDGAIDDGVPTTTWYLDADADGYGDASTTTVECAAPLGYVADATDCDDGDASIHPFGTELCDGVDQDCDGVADEGLTTYTWYFDDDGDGYGDASTSTASCSAPSGYVRDDDDCDDTDSAINPSATDVCDTLDNDCSGDADDGGLCPCDVEYYLGEPYMVCSAPLEWAPARTECLTYGYDLVAINDAAENSWIVSTATAAGFTSDSHFTWMGFNDRSSEGSWVWSSGDAVTYTNWNSGEPNDSSGEDCGHLWSSGKWNDIPCTGYTTPYICEP